ncbi:hypothetical protein Btru_054180 [Bulinus truncatus]|nr:hypothetical protein Btru_054180 [Bulinus truncatus]
MCNGHNSGMDLIHLTLMLAAVIAWSPLILSQNLSVTCSNNLNLPQYNTTVYVKLNGCNTTSDVDPRCEMMSASTVNNNVSTVNKTTHICTLRMELHWCNVYFILNYTCTTTLTSLLHMDVNCSESNVTVLWTSSQELISAQLHNVTEQITCPSQIPVTTLATYNITHTTKSETTVVGTVGPNGETSSAGVIVGVTLSVFFVAVIVCIVIFLHRKYDLSRLLRFLRIYKNADKSAQQTLGETKTSSATVADPSHYSSLQNADGDATQVNYSYTSLTNSSSNNNDDRRPATYAIADDGPKLNRGDSICYDYVSGNSVKPEDSDGYLDSELYLNANQAADHKSNVASGGHTMYQYVTNSLPGKEQPEDRSSNVYYNEMGADAIYSNER